MGGRRMGEVRFVGDLLEPERGAGEGGWASGAQAWIFDAKKGAGVPETAGGIEKGQAS
ncbi:MAG: hypothetical protein ACI8TQ_004061 [Planctomycetota bacterium]|jgi:hypothetical protein